MGPKRIIAVEEHFSTPLYREKLPRTAGRERNTADNSKRLGHDVGIELMDLGASRLAAMDAAGIDMQVLSFTSPGAQAFGPEDAVPVALDANDRLHEAIKAHPSRFAGFATLPTASPAKSAEELTRCVQRLGFKGALINGHANGTFLDDPKCWEIFECAESLDVPIYLHPTMPPTAVMGAYFDGYEEIGRAAWGFTIDTGTHVLRLIFCGLFDRFPKLKLIVGHLGEALPFVMHRMNDHTHLAARRRGLKKQPSEYLRDHVLVTTSGNFFTPALLCTMLALGSDNIMFSVDWPYESNKEGCAFLRHLPISEDDLEKIAYRNAERILRL